MKTYYLKYLKSMETITEIWTGYRHKKIPLYLLIILITNIIIAPAVYSATGTILTKGQCYALVLLGLVTFSIFIYLFVVIFQPEKF
jgi:K+-transporting ATPase KdpF subunit